MNKQLNIISNVLFVVCILLLAAVLIAPPLTGLTLEPVLSGSMEPTIMTGALIAIAGVNTDTLEAGDIIGFHVKGMDTPVCHRIYEVVETDSGRVFKTKGDANEDVDPWTVDPQNVIGKVYFNVFGVGYIARFAKTPLGFFLLMGVPALLIIQMEIRSLFFPPKFAVRKKPRLTQKKSGTPDFLVIVLGLAILGALWGVMAGNSSSKTLDSVAKAVTVEGEEVYVTQRNMQNTTIVPLVICISSSDENVTISETCFNLKPGEAKEIEITGENGSAVIKTAGILPLLPPDTLYSLFKWNFTIAPLAAAAVWILPLTLAAYLILKLMSSGPKFVPKAQQLRGE